MAQMFHQLTSLNLSLGMSTGDISHVEEVKLSCQLTRVCEVIKQATADLLELSILVPSAPWVSY